mgnify:CR=1 FL=1
MLIGKRVKIVLRVSSDHSCFYANVVAVDFASDYGDFVLLVELDDHKLFTVRLDRYLVTLDN